MRTVISTGKGAKPKGQAYNVSEEDATYLLKVGFAIEQAEKVETLEIQKVDKQIKEKVIKKQLKNKED